MKIDDSITRWNVYVLMEDDKWVLDEECATFEKAKQVYEMNKSDLLAGYGWSNAKKICFVKEVRNYHIVEEFSSLTSEG